MSGVLRFIRNVRFIEGWSRMESTVDLEGRSAWVRWILAHPLHIRIQNICCLWICLRIPSDLFTSGFRSKIGHAFLISSKCHMSSPSYLRFGHSDNIKWKIGNHKYNFLQSMLLGHNIMPHTHVLIPDIFFHPWTQKPSHIDARRQKILVTHRCVLGFRHILIMDTQTEFQNVLLVY